jgi:hypothetical protein
MTQPVNCLHPSPSTGDEAETTAIEAHVHDCGLCQRQVVELRAASGWLGVFEMATPPQWLRAAILQAGANDQPGPVDRRAGVDDRRVRRVVTPPAAGARRCLCDALDRRTTSTAATVACRLGRFVRLSQPGASP